MVREKFMGFGLLVAQEEWESREWQIRMTKTVFSGYNMLWLLELGWESRKTPMIAVEGNILSGVGHKVMGGRRRFDR